MIIINFDEGGRRREIVSFLFYIAVIVILNLIPLKAFAYSYGDPNKEAVAEAYKEMKEKLNEQPPNFAAAKEIFGTVKEEIDMHMGPEPSKAVLAAIEAKDRQAVIKDMEKTFSAQYRPTFGQY